MKYLTKIFLILLATTYFCFFGGTGHGVAGTVGIFLDCYTGSDTDVIGDIVIETEGMANLLILPELNQGKVIYTYSSPDYASNSRRSYTVDGRLFFKRKWSSGTLGVSEVDPHTFEVIRSFSLYENPGVNEFRFAIVGNKAYYHNSSEWDLLYGYIGGQFKVYDITTTIKATLLERGHQDNVGNPFSDNGILYSIFTEHIDEDSRSIKFYKRDLSSGTLSDVIGDFIFSGMTGYLFLLDFAVDDDIAYWPVVREADKQVEIWRYKFGDPLPQLIFAEIISNKLDQINEIDVENGQILLTLNESSNGDYYQGKILWLNMNDNKWSVIDTGVDIFDAEIFYYDTLPIIDEPGDSDSDNNDGSNDGEDNQNNDDGDGGGGGGGGGCFISVLNQ